MGYVLLWLEAMASALLLVAVVFSCSGRLKRVPALWPILLAILISVIGSLETLCAGVLYSFNIHPLWLFPYALAWTLLFIAGSWILIRRGRRRTGDTSSAATWSRSKLAGAFLIALVFQGFTMNSLDSAAKLEATTAHTSALSKVQNLLPAPPPDEQNAAELYQQAFKQMGKTPKWLLEAASDSAFDPASDKVKNYLREKKEAIALLIEAAQKPRLYYPVVLSPDFLFPEFFSFKRGAELLALDARVHARNGKMGLALKNISSMENIAEHLQQTPVLINSLLAITIHLHSKSALENILAELPERTQIRVSLPVKTRNSIRTAYRKSLVFEGSSEISHIAQESINQPSLNPLFMKDGKIKRGAGYFINYKLYRIFFFHDEKVIHEILWKKYQEFAQKPYYESGSDLKEWSLQLGDSIGLGLFTSFEGNKGFSYYFERVTRAQTQLLLGKLGLATAAYRSDHGRYPAVLDALVPKYITEVPIDPFSGDFLKIKTVDGGLILYGVGPDLKDDGGAAYDNETDEGDIAFYFGSAYTEHRLKPAIEKMKNRPKEEE